MDGGEITAAGTVQDDVNGGLMLDKPVFSIILLDEISAIPAKGESLADSPFCFHRTCLDYCILHRLKPVMILLESVWNRIQLPEFSRVEQDITTDVLIVGGGMAGVLTAYMLERAGVDYLLIEADRIGGGISANTTAKITSQHGLIYGQLIDRFDVDKARMYWEANEQARKQFQKFAQFIDCDFEVKDNYIYSRNAPSKLEKELAALERIRVPAQFVKQLPLPFSTVGAVRFPDQAQFHPLKFLAEISRGLRIYERTAARAFHGNTVITDGGKIYASKVIVATHFPMLNKHGGYFLKMYQDRSYAVAVDRAQNMNGMYLDESEQGLSFRNYGDLLVIGGGGHRTGKQGSAWSELDAFARRYYPKSRVKYRWAAQDCMTLDGIPYIGQYGRRTPDLYVATGFNKWGMTSSMVAAMILRDLVQEKENPYASVFSPARTILRPQLLVNAFEATVNLLTPTVPRCPHLGCALKWNAQEHTWDCPCHGSRFGKNGQLLDNPATGDLKK